MANTFELIASNTVGSGGAATITFSSIPSTFTDLSIYVSGRTTFSATRTNLNIDFNGLTTNRSYRNVRGFDSGSVGSVSASNSIVGYVPGATATASTWGSTSIYIPNYASSSINKSISSDTVAENNSSTAWMVGLFASLWSATSAITSITLDLDDGDFAQYSTAYLYGVKNA
jgi:hypothetical protein